MSWLGERVWVCVCVCVCVRACVRACARACVCICCQCVCVQAGACVRDMRLCIDACVWTLGDTIVMWCVPCEEPTKVGPTTQSLPTPPVICWRSERRIYYSTL